VFANEGVEYQIGRFGQSTERVEKPDGVGKVLPGFCTGLVGIYAEKVVLGEVDGGE